MATAGGAFSGFVAALGFARANRARVDARLTWLETATTALVRAVAVMALNAGATSEHAALIDALSTAPRVRS
jgi:hypothetical protein